MVDQSLGQGDRADLEVTILNILRTEPPHLYDFLDYGGLPRTAFRALQRVPNLDALFEGKENTVCIPSSSSGGVENHEMRSGTEGEVSYIYVNAYNNFSRKRDLKIFARWQVNDQSGKNYWANFLALEVYRGEGDKHPIWELGLYLTERDKKSIIQKEDIVVEIPDGNARLTLFRKVMISINDVMHKLFAYYDGGRILQDIINEVPEVSVVTPSKFREQRHRWFAYLSGTMERLLWFQIEDPYNSSGNLRQAPVIYEAALVSSHLLPGHHGHYKLIGRTTIANSDIALELPPIEFDTHEKALGGVVSFATHYLDVAYQHARNSARQFDVAPNLNRIEFRFAKFVEDFEGQRIAIASYVSQFGKDNRKLPIGQTHHYFSFYGEDNSQVEIREDVHFPRGIDAPALLRTICTVFPAITYGEGTSFRRELPILVPGLSL